MVCAQLFMVLAAAGALDGGVAPPLALQATAVPQKVKLGEPFVLELVITHHPSQRYELEAPGALGDFEYLGQTRSREDSGERSTTTLKVSLAAFAVGELTTPALELLVTQGAASARQSVPRIEVLVASSLPDDAPAAGADLYDVRAPEEVPVRTWRLVYALLGALVAAVAAFLLLRWLRSRKTKAAPPPAPDPLDVRTARSLDELAALDLPGKGRFKEFYFRLSEIFRSYLGARFGFEALESTTPELLDALRTRHTPGLALEEVAAFAERSDVARYARAEPTVEECQGHLDLVYRIVSQTTNATRAPQQPQSSSHGPH